MFFAIATHIHAVKTVTSENDVKIKVGDLDPYERELNFLSHGPKHFHYYYNAISKLILRVKFR
jgi:hypothetical protein